MVSVEEEILKNRDMNQQTRILFSWYMFFFFWSDVFCVSHCAKPAQMEKSCITKLIHESYLCHFHAFANIIQPVEVLRVHINIKRYSRSITSYSHEFLEKVKKDWVIVLVKCCLELSNLSFPRPLISYACIFTLSV